MNKENTIKTIQKIKAESKKRNFVQKIDMIINLKDIDLKKTENHVDFYTQLHYSVGKDLKICGLVGYELSEDAKKHCDKVITQEDFAKLEGDKKAIKKLADEYDYFIAQANLMGMVAKTFGKILGPRSKMPNPKAGCVVPPKGSTEQIVNKLRTTVRFMAKKDPVIQLIVGNVDMKEDEVYDNINLSYNQLIHHLPSEKNNIKSILIKTTMGKPEKLDF